ncbi:MULTISPECIES: PadR family transcriptional regulator [Weeksella]|uniref:Transcriptional regulator, PadR-like family n=1 Tax=Weeksella virosa (strain ATCC 43766 / DSM 16922 / JCM 21250 / CCUG 30538 / CDC 9751 / IAM 14551 / NBRC 16016 / NCTC 11634 / CL345/78) TaxID=865938 RepID=F0NYI8_WEEVC|nr:MULTISPECIES: PadR family transcriptional regulator [Weeksella]ADX67108.1 transcriptional regulator, PadR-like family [Weeksella virosa DSM 16922]MDK7375650.1 PadR family transcriptional regulator [Weeksella virosa]MDK7675035.1 PadR family transcriptional regulator [Weeksella virosa]OFM82388.1 PadR family transcriptional regulator [Weeksella sp. HMSC059D05]SUP53379.1 lineage-specific thermal regulator protein [Weeksella virosa]
MSIEKTQVQMRKGILEYCILSIIKRGDAYASDIIAELKQAEMIVVEGTLYPLLTRLKNDNLLQYRWEESSAGPPRKYYSLTTEGEEFLEHLGQTWQQLKNAVEKVTQVTH